MALAARYRQHLLHRNRAPGSIFFTALPRTQGRNRHPKERNTAVVEDGARPVCLLDDADAGAERGEGVRRDVGPGVADGAEEGRLAGVGVSHEAHLG